MFTQDDYINEIETARENGEIKGRAEGRAEGEAQKAVDVARALKASGVSCDIIANATGLSQSQIEDL